jgi:prepilin-type N-terminal cleavage/methylation domain-containing protein
MMNMIMKKRMELKKKGKKGFTLIEVIVVIVILAILAAIAVPALTGYIDKARDKGLEADGHNIMVALQSIGTDAYSANKQGDLPDTGVEGTITAGATTGSTGTTYNGAIEKLTGNNYAASGTLSGIKYDKTSGKLTGFKYTLTGGKYVEYTTPSGKGTFTIS